MKFHRFLILAGIFFLALFSSRSISLSIFHPYSFILPEYSISSHDISSKTVTLPGEQLNLLIIQLNHSPNPKPIGIWWIALASDTPVTLVSLYPSVNLEMESLLQDFQITEDKFHKKQLSADFVTKINEQDIPWDGYLILEPAALTILIDSLEGLKINGVVMDGEMVTDRLATLSPESIQGRAFQSDVWSKLCHKVIFAGSTSILEITKKELSKHTILSPDFPLSFNDIQVFLSTSNIKQCEVNLLKSESPINFQAVVMSENIYRRSDGN